MITVTRDSGANVKLLKRLERLGFILITDVLLENGRENRKVARKVPAIGVIGHSRIGECVIARNDSPYAEIRSIIGKQNTKDAMHLEAHLRVQNDFFVTEDTDFLKHREHLKRRFGCQIVTPEELERIVTP